MILDKDFLFKVIFVLFCSFLSTFVTKNLLVKIIIYILTVIITFYGYLIIMHETSGMFYKSGDRLSATPISITGAGHCPISIILKVKWAGYNEVIAEGIELNETIKSDDRTIDGKLFRVDLLSFDADGFTVNLTNETGKGVEILWRAKYNIFADCVKKLVKVKESRIKNGR